MHDVMMMQHIQYSMHDDVLYTPGKVVILKYTYDVPVPKSYTTVHMH